MTEAKFIELNDDQQREFRSWCTANNYAEFPDRFGYNNGCAEHPKQGKLYHYQRGGYYRCYQCVKAEWLQENNLHNDNYLLDSRK